MHTFFRCLGCCLFRYKFARCGFTIHRTDSCAAAIILCTMFRPMLKNAFNASALLSYFMLITGIKRLVAGDLSHPLVVSKLVMPAARSSARHLLRSCWLWLLGWASPRSSTDWTHAGKSFSKDASSSTRKTGPYWAGWANLARIKLTKQD